MKRILVTGGAGFIGSHLCERLINEGNQVACLDNFLTGKLVNLSPILKHPNFQLAEHDVTIPLHFDVDEIYNLACPASPVQYQRDPIQTTKTIVLGAINVLELAKKTGARVLQASTSEVYGDPLVPVQDELYNGNVNPIGVRACYDEGKRCAETLCADYYRQHGVDVKIARIFNTYGPRMAIDDGRVISNFIVKALQNRPLYVHGHGDHTRSFCYVDDTVDALVRLMATNETGPINIGNPQEISIRDLADLVIQMTYSASYVIHQSEDEDDPKRRCPNISTAAAVLDWLPTVTLNAGLLRTIDYFKGVVTR